MAKHPQIQPNQPKQLIPQARPDRALLSIDAEAGIAQFPAQACMLQADAVVWLDAPAIVEGGVAKASAQKFSMVANSGKPIAGHGWFGTLGVNLSGVKWSGDKIPVLLDHDTSRRLGFTTSLKVDEKRGLVAEGVLIENEDGKQVALDSKAGFPWQASVYLKATKLLEIRAGETHTVNGHEMTGPGYVFEESQLREVTFTALGADPNTSAEALSSTIAATVSASVRKPEPIPMTTEIPTPATPDVTTLRAEAQTAERNRSTAILNAAASEQRELAAELVTSGATVEEALLRFNADLQQRLTAKQAAAAPALQPVGAGNRAAEGDADAALAAMPEGDEKWGKQWDSSAALREEFEGSKAAWLCFQKNKSRVRMHGSAERFHTTIVTEKATG